MKTNYFTKIENKYVFNVSLIIWHLIIALASIAIVISLLVFLWGLIPPSSPKVEKTPYPEKVEYPSPVSVSLNELIIKKLPPAQPSYAAETEIQEETKEVKPQEDLRGKTEYDAVVDTLKILIPPSKYKWEGEGHYIYPKGEAYWEFYQREIYRKWVITKEGLMDRINSSYVKTNANNYYLKRDQLKSYVNFLKNIPESKRIQSLDQITSNVIKDFSLNNNALNAIVPITKKIDLNIDDNIKIIGMLLNFCNRRADGISFIEYVTSIADKFAPAQQYQTLSLMINGYNRHFDGNINLLKDATDLFIQMLSQIDPKNQATILSQYYIVFARKNDARNMKIRQIDTDYEELVRQIDEKFEEDQIIAQMEYSSRKLTKENLRMKSIAGIGLGIILIVFVGTFLAFLSIQRSVRKMEESINNKQ
ncbi:hypothetical protein U5907_03870 [Bacteroidales bacterium MB20-C3-3]|jgi:hypothetical protein|nr:hypothetical protein U5907_03870 [Bacteroidales bacterium MB20-C3-3]